MKQKNILRAALVAAFLTFHFSLLTSSAQTLNVAVGNVTDQYPAAQAGEMTYTGGTALTILGKTYQLADITKTFTDESSVKDNNVNVVYNGTGALVYVAGNVAQYVDVTVNGAHVSISQKNTDAVDGDEITYTLSGTTADGSLALDGKYKCTVSLAGVSLTNPNGAAINITNKKRIQISAKKNTENVLADGAGGSQKGCLYSKGQIQLQGNGTLTVTGNTKHAIKSGDYITVKNLTLNITSAAGDGISCNKYFQMKSGTVTIKGVADDGIQCDLETDDDNTGETTDHEDENSGNVYLEGGTLNVTVTADAAKGVKSEGDMKVSDGDITITTTGGGVWDSEDVKTKASSCLSADGNMTISGGKLILTSTGAGGKGINVDGKLTATGGTTIIKTTGNAVVASNTGALSVVTSSQQLDRYSSNYKSSPKGIKVDGAIQISDNAVISVTTSGAGGEGIESKNSITISGGQTTVVASDDAINASYNTNADSGDMTITGGYVYAYSTGNDGLDSNGNLYIKGGLVYAIGSGGVEKSIDANTEKQKKLYITGGTIIAVGDLESGSSISGGTCKYTTSWNAQQWYALYNGGTLVAAFKTPTKSSSGGWGAPGGPGGPGGGGGGSQKLIVYTSSTPTISTGTTNTPMTVTGGTEYFDGVMNIGGTVAGATSNVTLSNYSSGGGW